MKWTNKGHQHDELGNFLKGVKTLYLYGAGEEGKKFYEKLKWLGIIDDFDIYFVDSDINKQKMLFCDKSVISPESFVNNFNNQSSESAVVICTKLKQTAICILNDINHSNAIKLNYNCFTTCKEPYRENMTDKLFLPVLMYYKYNKLYMGYVCQIPTSRCSLKCKDCLNFITHFKEPYDDTFETVKSDADIYFSKVDFTSKYLMNGGEILLMQNLPQIIDYIGKNYRDRINEFILITNATIVPNDELVEAFVQNKVTVHVDDYRQALPALDKTYVKVIEKLTEANVNFFEARQIAWFDLKFKDKDYYLDDEEKTIVRSGGCNLPYRHSKNGKLAFCDWQSFAVDAGLEQFTEGDYLDINKSSKVELMEFDTGFTKKGYVEMCKYCAGNITINENIIPSALQQGCKEALVKFCEKYNHVYIYGAGKFGKYFYNMLENKVDITGFIVSDFHRELGQLCHKTVFELSEVSLSDSTGIVLAVGGDEKNTIFNELKHRGFSNVYNALAVNGVFEA